MPNNQGKSGKHNIYKHLWRHRLDKHEKDHRPYHKGEWTTRKPPRCIAPRKSEQPGHPGICKTTVTTVTTVTDTQGLHACLYDNSDLFTKIEKDSWLAAESTWPIGYKIVKEHAEIFSISQFYKNASTDSSWLDHKQIIHTMYAYSIRHFGTHILASLDICGRSLIGCSYHVIEPLKKSAKISSMSHLIKNMNPYSS